MATSRDAAALLGSITSAEQKELLAIAHRSDELRVTYPQAVLGNPHSKEIPHRLNQSMPPSARCTLHSNANGVESPIPSIFSAETTSRCNTKCCRGFHYMLAHSTTTYHDEDEQAELKQRVACGVSGVAQKRAALLLRGRMSAKADMVGRVMRGYQHDLVCSLRRAHFRVDSFLFTYEPLPAEAIKALRPSLTSRLPMQNSSNLMSTLGALIIFVRYSARRDTAYDFVVLTRMDLLIKQPLMELSSLSTESSLRRFHFVFKAARSNWREWISPSVCRQWDSTRRVADTIHAFAGAWLPCVMRAMEHYMLHEREQLHYLYTSIIRFIPANDVGFLVPGCYDSDPAKGQRNPVYDIAPRNEKYNGSICRNLREFTYEQPPESGTSDGQYCCQSERYCCPSILKRCPTRSARYPYFPQLSPNGTEYLNLSRWLQQPRPRLPSAAYFGYITTRRM